LTKAKKSDYSGERLHVSPEVARLFAKDADYAKLLKVASGATALKGNDLVHALFLCCAQGDEELKERAIGTLRSSSNNALRSVIESSIEHPRILDFIARVRIDDLGTLILLHRNPVVTDNTWEYVFSHCNYEVLTHFCDENFAKSFPANIRAAVLKNHQASADLKQMVEATISVVIESHQAETDNADYDVDAVNDEDLDDEFDQTQTLSKQQIVMELGMAEKVKMAITGDKEWRSILVKDSNKTISSAVLKNPRITEGEILFLAQNRSSSEDIIREILLNREWLKNYAVRHALVMHPRTPLPQAIRFLNTLNDKDVRMIAKSRNVSSAIINNCRRMIAAKEKR